MKTRVLAASTMLFHGTDAATPFAVPRGCAWFAHDFETAAGWAGWRSLGDDARRRVLVLRTPEDIALLDTCTYEDWIATIKTVTGYTVLDAAECAIRDVARAVVAHGLRGWYGWTEIMLVDTSSLEPVDEIILGPRPCVFQLG